MLLPVYQKIKCNHNGIGFSQYFGSSPFPFKVCRNKRHFFGLFVWHLFVSLEILFQKCVAGILITTIFLKHKHYKMLCWSMQLGVWKKNIICYLKLNDSRSHMDKLRNIVSNLHTLHRSLTLK